MRPLHPGRRIPPPPRRGGISPGWRLTRLTALVLVAWFLQGSSAAAEPLRLAMSGAFRPFSTTDASGNLVGFDADIAREVALRLDREPELVQTDWAGIQAGLQSGKFDLICGSMAITDERLQSMYFSLPYYVSGAQVFVRRGVGSLEGRRVGVTEDSTYERFLLEHPDRFPDVEIVRYGSEAEIVAALSTDKIDAFISDRIVGGFYVKAGGGDAIVPLGPLLYQEACGIAARRNAPGLVREVNRALFSLVQDGGYARIYRHWTGVDPDLETLLASWGEYASTIPRDAGVDGGGEAAGRTTRERPDFAESFRTMLPLLGRGAILTLQLSILTAVFSLLSGAAVGVATVARSGLVSGLARGFIWLVRGTPLLVQLFIAYFAVATAVNRIFGAEVIGAFGAALLALVVNTTSYNAETLRGGIGAVDKGQWDAAASLGMTRAKILRRVVLPQAFRDSLPSLGNNMVVLIKDTSLVGAITLIELTYAARNVVFQTGRAFFPFLLAAAFYLIIIVGVTLGIGALERRLQRSRGRVGGSI